MQYGTVNLAARKLIDHEDLLNPGLYPNPEVMAKLERMKDLGTKAEAFDDAWVTLRAEDPSAAAALDASDAPRDEVTEPEQGNSQPPSTP